MAILSTETFKQHQAINKQQKTFQQQQQTTIDCWHQNNWNNKQQQQTTKKQRTNTHNHLLSFKHFHRMLSWLLFCLSWPLLCPLSRPLSWLCCFDFAFIGHAHEHKMNTNYCSKQQHTQQQIAINNNTQQQTPIHNNKQQHATTDNNTQ